VKNLFFYLTTLTILFYASDLAAQNCDRQLFDTEYRNYNTVYINLKTVSLNAKESLAVNTTILGQLEKLPNNIVFKNDPDKNKKNETEITPDRILTGKIVKTVIKKEKYAGETGKDQYLIKIYESVFYELDIELKKNPEGNIIYRYKKYFNEQEFKNIANEIYTEIEPLYAEPIPFCVKKVILDPKEYFLNLYMINGFPINDYREFLVYSFGIGGMFGIRGIGADNFILSVYIETAGNTTDNPDINYAATIQGGIGAGYNLDFKNVQMIPEITLGYMYSFYDVRYSDMETSYRNIIFRSALEIDTGIFEKTFFIKPVFSNIFEEGNTFYSMDLLLGIKIKI